MKVLLYFIFMLSFVISVFTQDITHTLKSIKFEKESTKLVLIIHGLVDESPVIEIEKNIQKSNRVNLESKEIDLVKGTCYMEIASEDKLDITETTKVLTFLGITKIIYEGNEINISGLPAVYKPFVQEEIRQINRPQ